MCQVPVTSSFALANNRTYNPIYHLTSYRIKDTVWCNDLRACPPSHHLHNPAALTVRQRVEGSISLGYRVDKTTSSAFLHFPGQDKKL